MSPVAIYLVHVAGIIYESRVPREDALKAAIAAHEDVDVLQKLCEGRKVPAELRMELWKVGLSPDWTFIHNSWCLFQECLGVSRRPDTLGSWTGPLDCEGQDTIHSQCQEAGGEHSISHPAYQP